MNSTRQESFAAALAAAHRALAEDLRLLEAAVAPSWAGDRRELSDRLRSLRTHLDAHFRFEEQDGYMQAVLARAPHLARQVEALRCEHSKLSESFGALAAAARAAPTVDEALRQKVREWIGCARDHERRENLLVADVFNRDVAAED